MCWRCIGRGASIDRAWDTRDEEDMQHYTWTTSPTEIQVHDIGPFAINYVNAADDPCNAKTSEKK